MPPKPRGRPRKSQPPTIPRRQPAGGIQRKIRQRQEVVETKSRTHEEMAIQTAGKQSPNNIPDPTDYGNLNSTAAYTFLHPMSFLSLNQGLSEDAMVGQTITSKALKMKVSILMPHNVNAITEPFNLYMVHGFVNAPNFAASVFGTNPIAANAATRENIKDYIKNKVIAYFDERKDKLRFIPKNGVTCQILGYKKILNDKNTAWLGELTNTPSPKSVSITWPCMKKVKYEQGVPTPAQDNNTLSPANHFYPNYRRLPFCMVYSPQWESISPTPGSPADKYIRLAYNDCHWFTDS